MNCAIISVLLLCLIACGPKKAIEPVITEPEPVVEVVKEEPEEDLWQASVEQSLSLFDQGIEVVDEDYLLAISFFDLAVLELLDCRDLADGDPRWQDHLDELIHMIHEVERQKAPESPTLDTRSGENTLSHLLADTSLDFESLEATPEEQDDVVTYDMPVVHNKVVDRFIETFTTTKAHVIGASLERSTRYLPMIREIFAEEGLPMDLAYLPIIESGFKLEARSRAKAVGLWQFVAYVGRHYGLTIDWYEDERRDAEAATRAAAKYFKELYADLGDWNLALCAYNYGPGRVKRAVRRGRSRDFWTLSRKRLLPRETRGYVPAFMAGVIIAKNPDRYGFGNIEYQQDPDTEKVSVDFSLRLSDLAERMDVDVAMLRQMNPTLFRGVTPANRAFSLTIPDGMAEVAKEVLDSIPPEERNRLHRYTMRRGDTLSGIARRFDASVDNIMLANNIRNPRRLRAGRTLLIPLGPTSDQPLEPVAADTPKKLPRKSLDYRLKNRDSLYLLSKRYQTTIASLIALNPDVDPLKLRPGKTLKIEQGDIWENGGKIPSRTKGYSLYRVRKGDTASKIARRFRTSTDHLLRANGLSARSILKIGQMLKIPNTHSAKDRVVTYRVKPGDSLSKVARRFKTSVAQLVEWNQLPRADSIKVGQRLLIYR